MFLGDLEVRCERLETLNTSDNIEHGNTTEFKFKVSAVAKEKP